MRWQNDNPRDGDYRTIRRFALFPICTPNETRWLVWCDIEQQYSGNWADDGWHNVRFVDNYHDDDYFDQINITD
jgi:hypothetical protein